MPKVKSPTSRLKGVQFETQTTEPGDALKTESTRKLTQHHFYSQNTAAKIIPSEVILQDNE